MNDWHQTETYKSLITISVEGLKMLALANGGAAVALLTYLGNLAAKTETASKLPLLRPALVAYCIGLFLTLVAFVLSYATQLALHNDNLRPGRRERHGWFLWSGMIAALMSAIAFGFGCLSAADALTGVGPEPAGWF